MLNDLYEQLINLDNKITEYDRILSRICHETEACQRLMTIPGIGILTATYFYALLGCGAEFKNGRHVSAYLGLVPRQHSSGRRQLLLGITKRGDKYLRTLLTHGGRSVLRTAGRHPGSLHELAKRLKSQKHANKASVAIANKLARIAWAVLKGEQSYLMTA